MKNKRGWIRTLEAVIAILLVLGFVAYVYPKGVSYEGIKPQIVESSQSFIMKNILETPVFRSCVLGVSCEENCACESELSKQPFACWENDDGVKNLIESNLPAGYDYSCEICSKSVSCITLPVISEKDVYTNSIYVSGISDGQSFGKVMRIYFWES